METIGAARAISRPPLDPPLGPLSLPWLSPLLRLSSCVSRTEPAGLASRRLDSVSARRGDQPDQRRVVGAGIVGRLAYRASRARFAGRGSTPAKAGGGIRLAAAYRFGLPRRGAARTAHERSFASKLRFYGAAALLLVFHIIIGFFFSSTTRFAVLINFLPSSNPST